MAIKPNYKFQKRQRELEKQKKKAEKAERRARAAESGTTEEGTPETEAQEKE